MSSAVAAYLGGGKDSIDEMIANAEKNIIASSAGAVPPHMDDGGHLPFGGSIGGTRGPSLFGKRKIVTSDADPNPQALLLNFPPQPSVANIQCWEKNCAPARRRQPLVTLSRRSDPPQARRVPLAPLHRVTHERLPASPPPGRPSANCSCALVHPSADKSNMFEDPSAAAVRFNSTNYVSFGPPDKPSCLAETHRSMGNLRQTANTRPTPSPAFYPPERETHVEPERTDYNWKWPVREKRPPPPRLKRRAASRPALRQSSHALVTLHVRAHSRNSARCASGRPLQVTHSSFLEEYELRPPWLKY